MGLRHSLANDRVLIKPAFLHFQIGPGHIDNTKITRQIRLQHLPMGFQEDVVEIGCGTDNSIIDPG